MPSPSDASASGLRFGPDQFAALVESLPAGVFILDRTGTAVYANAAAKALLGRGIVADDHADNLSERFAAVRMRTEEPYPSDQMPIVRALAGERSHVDDMDILRTDGERISLEVTATPIVDRSGMVTFAVAVFQDITERRRAEDALAKFNEDLEQQIADRTIELADTVDALEAEIARRILYEQQLLEAKANADQANRAKSVFLMSVSHELRTPLNHVIGFSDLLAERVEDPKHRKLAETTGASGRDLLDKVDGLIELARAETAPLGDTTSEFDGDALLREVIVPLGIRWDDSPPIGVLLGKAESTRQVLHQVLRQAAAVAQPDECRLSARVERHEQGGRIVIRITSAPFAERVRTVSQLFGDSNRDNASRFRQHPVDFQVAVARARIRVIGGDLTASADPDDDAVEVTLPLS
jgi:PAS domain S-box-containing protein